MKETSSTVRVTGGLSFSSLLAVVFIALKLLGTITWSWWWVLSPLWIPWAIIIAVCLGCGLVALLGLALAAVLGRRSDYKVWRSKDGSRNSFSWKF
jgi:hypothetical protein